eukprot:4060081-Heterocapsa_arctica.AAC.1
MGHGPPPTSAHEPHCRRRIEAKLAEDDKFSERLTERRRVLEQHVPESRGDGAATAGGGGGATYHRH